MGEKEYAFLSVIKGKTIVYNPLTGEVAEEYLGESGIIVIDDPEILKKARGLVERLNRKKEK